MQEESSLSSPATKAGRTQRVVLALLREHDAADAIPTNGRFVFYELEQRGLARKAAHDDTRPNKRRSHGWPPGGQDITDALTFLRQRGVIPWMWIEDEGRSMSSWRTAASVTDYVSETIAEASIDPWDGEAPVVLCESRATAGVLERVCGEYAVGIAGTGGHCAGFLRTVVAPRLEVGQTVLWLGDLDFSGGHIENAVRRTLEDEIGEPLNWHRLAMTEELATARGITPIQKTDGRTHRTHPAIEVESLGQAELVALLRAMFDTLLPEPLASVHERERREREQVRLLLNGGR